MALKICYVFSLWPLSDKSFIWLLRSDVISPDPEAVSPDPLAEQKRQPPVPLLPSLLGHVNPPSRESLTIFPPNFFLRYVLMVLIRSS